MQVTPQAALASRTVSWNPVSFEKAAAEWLSEAEKSRSPASRGSRNSQADFAPGSGYVLLIRGVFCGTVIGSLSSCHADTCAVMCCMGICFHTQRVCAAFSALPGDAQALQAYVTLRQMPDICFHLRIATVAPQNYNPHPPPRPSPAPPPSSLDTLPCPVYTDFR